MDIRISPHGLKSLSSETAPFSHAPQSKSGCAIAGSGHAKFGSAVSRASRTGSRRGVRFDMVAAVQAALASGTYDVPALAVASKVVSRMMGE